MMLVNGLRVLFSLGINGLTNIDQEFDAASENPQSGIAIGTHLQNTFADHTPTDQVYKPTSTNAQSGLAVAAAVAGVGEKEWTLVDDVTFTETVASYSLDLSAGSYTELYIEGMVYAADRTTEKQNFVIGISNTVNIARINAAFGHASYEKVFIRAHLSLSPSGTYIAETTASLFGYTLSGTHDEVTGRLSEKTFTGKTYYPSLYMAVAGQFAENTTFKIWGR